MFEDEDRYTGEGLAKPLGSSSGSRGFRTLILRICLQDLEASPLSDSNVTKKDELNIVAPRCVRRGERAIAL